MMFSSLFFSVLVIGALILTLCSVTALIVLLVIDLKNGDLW